MTAATGKTRRVFVGGIDAAVERLLNKTGWSGAHAATQMKVSEDIVRMWRAGGTETITRKTRQYLVTGMNRSTLDAFVDCYKEELGSKPKLRIFPR